MKKIYLLLLAVAVSCNMVEVGNDLSGIEPVPERNWITETISGSHGVETKATIDNDDASIFKWSIGDNIAVHVSNGNSHQYVVTSKGADAAAASASFSVTYDSGYSRDAFAVYPSTIVAANASNYGQSGHTLDVTLPPDYTLAQVQGEVSPCPMVATNSKKSFSWNFYQLCSLLRITVSNIPATAKRLEIDFDGKKVWGDFSIASGIVPGTSVIATATDANHDVISITKDGTDAILGETSLALNIPLPVGTYSKITVNAYDAVSGGNVISFDNISFGYTADITKGVKKSSALTDQSIFTFTFRDADTQTNLGGLRFVRLFSCQNKLYNGSTTFGPYTVSSATGTADMANPVVANLKFASDDGDQLAFQVIDANGKVYSGLYNAPAGGFTMGKYDLTVDVKAYTFTVETNGTRVYFSPGDLGVDNGVYSFTEPFTTWGHGNTTAINTVANAPAQRVWFDFYYDADLSSEITVNGITDWRIPKRSSTSFPNVPYPYEWNNIMYRTNMDNNVAPYYRVIIPNHQYCLLLPPDETLSSDIGDDLTSGNVTDYAKYLGKGFVLLMNTNRGILYGTKWSWGTSTSTFVKQGFYWTMYNNSNRYYLETKESDVPAVNWGANRMRNHIRYVRNVQ